MTTWICRSYQASSRKIPLVLSPRRVSQRWFSGDSKLQPHPALLKRARTLAAEHERLEATLRQGFDSHAATRISDLTEIAAALKSWDSANELLAELHALTQLRDEELRQLAKDDIVLAAAQLQQAAHQLAVSLTPKDPYSDMGCVVEIIPGVGGMEGRLFADALFRMYRQFLTNQGLRPEIVKYELFDEDRQERRTGESPLIEGVLEVSAPGSYGRLRGEAGVHRVQRVPTTEKGGRTHTSAAAVWILPAFPETHGDSVGDEAATDSTSEFYIAAAEVRTETMRAGGPGGQHVNKTESAVRLTHEPTGITVSMSDQRSKPRNMAAAWRLLRARVAARRREARLEEIAALRDSVMPAGALLQRGAKVRTYNYSQDRCTDHRSGITVSGLVDVLQGGDRLQRVVDSVASWLLEKDLDAIVADEERSAASAAAASAAASPVGRR